MHLRFVDPCKATGAIIEGMEKRYYTEQDEAGLSGGLTSMFAQAIIGDKMRSQCVKARENVEKYAIDYIKGGVVK